MKRVTRVNPGFVLIAASAVALMLAACVEEGDDAPPLPGAAGSTRATGGSAGSGGGAGTAGSGGGMASGGTAGQGGSAGQPGGAGGQAGSVTMTDAGADAS